MTGRQGRGADRDRDGRGERSDRHQDAGMATVDRRGGASSYPAPSMEGQKPQRSKGKGKDDYKKKDYRRDDDDDRMNKGKKKNEPKQQMQKPQQKEQKVEEVKSIVIPEVLTIKELADR